MKQLKVMKQNRLLGFIKLELKDDTALIVFVLAMIYKQAKALNSPSAAVPSLSVFCFFLNIYKYQVVTRLIHLPPRFKVKST